MARKAPCNERCHYTYVRGAKKGKRCDAPIGGGEACELTACCQRHLEQTHHGGIAKIPRGCRCEWTR